MSTVTVRIPMPLRSFTGGAGEVRVQGHSAGEALRNLGGAHAGLPARIMTPEGRLRTFVNVFKGTENINDLQGLDTVLADGDVLTIVPAVAGGSAPARDRRLAELRSRVPQVTPAEALALQAGGAVLVDVRERDEIAAGSPPGAVHLGRGYLELRIEDVVPDANTPVLTLCDGGTRSLFAAEDLRAMGYTRVSSVSGGFTRWKDEGLPVRVPRLLGSEGRARYARHLLMPEVGEQGQLKLLDARVLIVGAGGLGSPAALYLAAAGVGTLGVVDHDLVDRSNLQRQILHTDARVGHSKVDSARTSMLALNPTIAIESHEARLERNNVEAILGGYDVVVDGSDNFPTRYLVNDACVKLGIPNVHGAIFRFEGQVSVFWPARAQGRGPCYRCLYPEPPPPELAPSCAEAGVLGVLPGVIGTLQAVEAIKLVLGIGEPLVGRMLYYEALPARFSELTLKRDPACRYCADGAEFPGYVDYEAFCRAS